MINLLLTSVRNAMASAMAFLVGLIYGKGIERAKQIKKQNKELRDNIALSDRDLADKLRERARRKSKNSNKRKR